MLVDAIKSIWEKEVTMSAESSTVDYLSRLSKNYLTNGNLKQVTDDSNLLYKLYSDKIIKMESIELFLE